MEHKDKIKTPPPTEVREYLCKVTISRAIESDDGNWKGVIKSGSHTPTYFEYSQVVKVRGKII